MNGWKRDRSMFVGQVSFVVLALAFIVTLVVWVWIVA